MSGGRSTLQRKKGIKNLSQSGDITCIDKKGQPFMDRFMVECKFYANLDIESGLLFGKGNLAAFWRKHVKLSRKQGKAPLLIAKQNRTHTLVLMDNRAFAKMVTFEPFKRRHDKSGLDYRVMSTRLRLGFETYIFTFKEIFGSKV